MKEEEKEGLRDTEEERGEMRHERKIEKETERERKRFPTYIHLQLQILKSLRDKYTI